MFGNQIRFTGMTSGMDTNTIVQQLMRAESMRMDRLSRRRQLASWRQEQFRDIATNLRTFSDDHLSAIGRPNNVIRSSTWAAWQTTVSADNPGFIQSGISVTAANNAIPGRFHVQVYQLAAGATATGVNVNVGRGGDGEPPAISAHTRLADTGWFAGMPSFADSATRITSSVVAPTDFGVAAPAGWQSHIHTSTGVPAVFTQANYDFLTGTPFSANVRATEVGGQPFYFITLSFDDTGDDIRYFRVQRNATTGEFELYNNSNIPLAESVVNGNNLSDVTATVQNFTHTQLFTTTININDVDIVIHANYNVEEFRQSVNAQLAHAVSTNAANNPHAGAYLSFANGVFTLTASSTGENGRAEVNMGVDASGIMAQIFGAAGPTTSAGQQGIIYLRNNLSDAGERIYSSNNQFNRVVNGQTTHTITVTGARVNETFTVDTTTNSNNAIQAVRDFVEAYNALVMMLHTATTTNRPRTSTAGQRSFFEPLLESERREMSDREIERWEEQARTGLLHRDGTLRDIQAQMRRQINDGVLLPDGTRIFLHQIGVTPSGSISGQANTNNIGLLTINEEQLANAIHQDPARVGALFNNHPSNHLNANDYAALTPGQRQEQLGLGHRLINIVNNATGTTGSLTRQAGNTSYSQDRISRQIQAYDRRIDRMQDWLVRRENQLFRQFSMMEQAMARSHAQMDSLFMFGMN